MKETKTPVDLWTSVLYMAGFLCTAFLLIGCSWWIASRRNNAQSFDLENASESTGSVSFSSLLQRCLFFSSRRQLIAEESFHELNGDSPVLSNRFSDSVLRLEEPETDEEDLV